MEDDEAISLVVTALSVYDLFDTGNRSALDAFHCSLRLLMFGADGMAVGGMRKIRC